MALVRPETAGTQGAYRLRGAMRDDCHSRQNHKNERQDGENEYNLFTTTHSFTVTSPFFVLLREVFARVPDHFKRYGSGSVLGAFITVSKTAAIA